MADSNYRPCVVAVFTNAEGRVLIAERASPRGVWQFPQGGVEPGEGAAAAVAREMLEELGTSRFQLVRVAAETVRYNFPPDLGGPLAKLYKGQEQTWCMLRFDAGAGPDLAAAVDKELVQTAWVTPEEALQRAVDFKREAYEGGLAALGLLPRQAPGKGN